MPGDRRALNRTGQPRIDPVAGEEEAFDRRVDRRSRRLAGRQRKRRVLLADHRAAAQQRVAGAGDRLGDFTRRQRDERVVVETDEIVGPARHQRQVRRALSERLPLVEHPLHRASGKADEGVVHHRPVVPEIDGDDRLGRHPRSGGDRGVHERRCAGEQLRERKPRHRRDHLFHLDRFTTGLDAGHTVTGKPHARERVGPHLAVVGLDEPPGRHGVHLVQRRPGERDRRILRVRSIFLDCRMPSSHSHSRSRPRWP